MRVIPFFPLVFLAAGYLRSAEPLPNLVIFLADDMGLGDTSAYQDVTGNSDAEQLRTPGIERLARAGVRFHDAHAPSSRCTATRYSLLTGRYPWRTRLKWWVLFGSQGDPLIEAGRPTLPSVLREKGYSTTMVGKWHVGLRYRRSDGSPAAAWEDADLTRPLFTTPLDHGFDLARYHSRSHATSGPSRERKPNGPNQRVGPGHLDGRTVLAATDDGKRLEEGGADEYVLEDLGRRHSDNAIAFLRNHTGGEDSAMRPFFLYYASPSNHSPYTPSREIGGVAVAGEGRSMSGEYLGNRYDYIYENDVALARLLDFLAETEDPRRPGAKLVENTIVIFSSDNGAEIPAKTATGPWRSNKGSAYEGGHRVPFLVSWPAGGVGDGDMSSPGQDSDVLVSQVDLFATIAEITGRELPDWRAGAVGGEDSFSLLEAWRGGTGPVRPLFHNDHKEAGDGAAMAMRLDDPTVDGKTWEGRWKLHFDAALNRFGQTGAVELYELVTDPMETENRIADPELGPLVKHLIEEARRQRRSGGVRSGGVTEGPRVAWKWVDRGEGRDLRESTAARETAAVTFTAEPGITLSLAAERDGDAVPELFHLNPRGLGVDGGRFGQVDGGEALLMNFDRDVYIESIAIVAGQGVCGGFVRVGRRSPLAIYCIDADNDEKEQHGLMSDLGVLPAGEILRLDSSPHFGTEAPGRWRLERIAVRVLE